MKKTIKLLMLSAICALLLTGCRKKDDAEPKTDGAFTPSMNTEATASIEVRGSWANFEALDAVAADWNRIYPNVSVNYIRVDDYSRQLNVLVAGDDCPEIVMFSPRTYFAKRDKIEAALVDLNTIGMNTDIVCSGILDVGSKDGRLLSFSWALLSSGFVVNKSILSQLNLTVPTTREELEQVCTVLAENGYVPLSGSYRNFYALLMQNDRNLKISKEADQAALYERFHACEAGCGAYFEEEFARLFELMDSGYIDHEVNIRVEDIYEKAIGFFFEGKTPFFAVTTETVSGMKKRETKSEAFMANPFEYEFVSLPIVNETPALSIDGVQGLALVSGAKNEEWAKEFMRFVCTRTELERMASVKGMPSVIGENSEDERFTFLYEIPAENTVVSVRYPVIEMTDRAFNGTMWEIAAGKLKNVQEAEAHFEKKLKSWLEQNP